MTTFLEKLLKLIEDKMDAEPDGAKFTAEILAGCSAGIMSIFFRIKGTPNDDIVKIWDDIDSYTRQLIKLLGQEQNH